ncbi:MAG: UDP-N-acetylmuramate--L-alanine ligase [Gammaproteobacteria bacterium]
MALRSISHTRGIHRVQHIHLVGIGGAGMGGIAEILLSLGFTVSGSDQSANGLTRRLAQAGATIFLGHAAHHLTKAQLVVISTAIQEDNPEVIAAKQQGIPVLHRAAMLGELMRLRQGIAVAGTHGKTTTTSLVASLLMQGGLDPTFVIGGLLNSAGTNAKVGGGECFVAEADESDASFLYLKPWMAVVTNIDMDHLTTYSNDFSRLQETFLEFLHHLPFYGLAILCIDDPIVKQLAPSVARSQLTYGFDENADIRAIDFRQKGLKSYFSVKRPGHSSDLNVTLNMAGKHNVQNALAAIAVATDLGISDAAIVEGLAQFAGIGRRMQLYGDVTLSPAGGNALLIDDYGHHPREVAATIEAVRHAYPDRRLVVTYQPHRYSRTKALFDDFATVLSDVDALLLLEVHPAGEAPIAGADGYSLCRAIRSHGKVDPIFVEKLGDLPNVLSATLQDGDILLTQGAGSVGMVAPHFVSANMSLAQLQGKDFY